MKFAVVGSGISGLSMALILSQDHEVILYEVDDRFGGHSNTIEVNYNDKKISVDTGFIVFNKLNYPNLIKLFKFLSVNYQDSDMSLSIDHQKNNIEWSGQDIKTIFAKKKYFGNFKFLFAVLQILIFNFHVKYILNYKNIENISLKEWLKKKFYSKSFLELYLIPMAGAIWSMPQKDIMNYPVRSLFEFFNNHKLLHGKKDRPKWLTVSGGSINYVNKIINFLRANPRVKLLKNNGVKKIKRKNGFIKITDNKGNTSEVDHIIFSQNPSKVVNILSDIQKNELDILGKFKANKNTAYLHSDESIMPKTKKIWSSWNIFVPKDEKSHISVTYWMNKLQNINNKTPLFLSLNPVNLPNEGSIFKVIDYEHPVFDSKSITALKFLDEIQGLNNTWYCGAWSGNGFHEDGLNSSLKVANKLGIKALWD
ncbi:MAG: NAD(P)-binding protein [Pseudomonadota bacterium]|nr:NAD(P)-binding protein [Pseudomonadota bacterium]